MSHGVFTPKIRSLGESHYGRKTEQPSRGELQTFSREAEAKLWFPVLWWDGAERQALMSAFGKAIQTHQLTCYACAVLSNHVHILLRKHRLKAEDMIGFLKHSGQEKLHELELVPPKHPVFNADSCHIYKNSIEEMRTCIRYIERNYQKHRLPVIPCDFISPYDDWPYHKNNRF
jgi:REP element-mobilizing transposase RayT